MRAVRFLPVTVVWIAASVLLALLMSLTGFIPRRSIWSLIDGAVLLLGSTAEALLVPFMLRAFYRTSPPRSAFLKFAVTLGTLAALPAAFVVMKLAVE